MALLALAACIATRYQVETLRAVAVVLIVPDARVLRLGLSVRLRAAVQVLDWHLSRDRRTASLDLRVAASIELGRILLNILIYAQGLSVLSAAHVVHGGGGSCWPLRLAHCGAAWPSPGLLGMPCVPSGLKLLN